VKDDVGSTSQDYIRPGIAQQMADMLCCDIDEFLCHYAPFCPTDDSIDSALERLEHKRILQGNLWRDFSDKKMLSKTGKHEKKAFEGIKSIVKTLTEHNTMAPRTCNFKYSNCGDTHMTGNIGGSTFRVDACFSPLSSTPLAGKVVASQVAVAAEFMRKGKGLHNVRTQILNIDLF